MSAELTELYVGGDFKMDPEYENATIIDLPGGGQGSITLKDRIDSGEISFEDLEIATNEIVSGKYSVEAEVSDITKCGDGRHSNNPTKGTQLFGATAGLIKSFVGARLIDMGSAKKAIEKETALRTEAGKKSGGHTADTHGKPGCGCGECDGAENAISLMINAKDTVKGLVSNLYKALDFEKRYGFDFSDDEFGTRLATYEELHTAQNPSYFANGGAQVQAVAENTESESIEHLEGDHGEILWVINLRNGERFDREKFVSDHSQKNIMAFWEDQWAVEAEFRDKADGEETKFQSLIMSDLMRRVATAANLTKADLRIVILK